MKSLISKLLLMALMPLFLAAPLHAQCRHGHDFAPEEPESILKAPCCSIHHAGHHADQHSHLPEQYVSEKIKITG